MTVHKPTDITKSAPSAEGKENAPVTSVDDKSQTPSSESDPQTTAARDARHRPAYKLTVGLIDTYKLINKVYYEKKKRRERERNDREGAEINNGWDDENYDLILHNSEVIGERYEVKEKLGKGSFGQVVRAYDQANKEDVAVKIIKSKKPFLVQARIEIDLLNLLQEQDPEGNFRTVRMLNTFMYRGHQCIVFELLSCNLYELLRNTNFRGISLNLTRKFARQVLKTLDFLATLPNPIIHCDLKPENILLCHPRRSAIKVIDFGSACQQDNRMYSYIQSRFYRSPEVMMGLHYTTAIDVWSLGCILVEMHTGEPLFAGKDTHDQLQKVVELRELPPTYMIERCQAKYRQAFFCTEAHTDGTVKYRFRPTARSKGIMRCKEEGNAPSLEQILGCETGGPHGRRQGEQGHSPAHYKVFIDLVERMLTYDPDLRIKPSEALHHPFFMEESVINSVASSSSSGSISASASTSSSDATPTGTVTGTHTTEGNTSKEGQQQTAPSSGETHTRADAAQLHQQRLAKQQGDAQSTQRPTSAPSL